MIIIGDTHGEYDLLMTLISKLPHDNLCFVGDLIDRGPSSKNVVSFVKDHNFPCVLGNHEDFMIQSYNENQEPNETHYIWSMNGAQATINSYPNADLFFKHREWFKTLPIVYWVDEKTVVSHSRYLPFLNDDVKNPDVIKNILWSRKHYDHKKTNILNIHGHTIVDSIVNYNNYLNIDSGAFCTGILTAYDTETKIIYQTKG